MRTSILICATCLIVTGCSAQLRFPSLSSALSSLTGFGSGANSGSSSSSAASNGQSSSSSSSPYSGLVRDYGRNLMMAMSSIYPSIFKPPQSQQQSAQGQQQQQPQSPFEQFAAASQPLQSLFSAATGGAAGPSSMGNSGSSMPSFTLGGSTFSISPSFPFGSLGGGSGASQQQQQAQQPPMHQAGSPFSNSYGSSINSPPSFGAFSSGPFFQSQSMPSFAPASSYNAAFEAANGGAGSFGSSQGLPPSPSFQSGGAPPPGSGQGNSLNSFQSMPSAFNGQSFDSSAGSLLSSSVHQPQNLAPPPSSAGAFSGSPHSSFMSGIPPPQSAASQQQNGPLLQQTPQAASSAPQSSQVSGQSQFAHHHSAQQYRPDMMSIAASAPVPSSNSYSNYGNIPSGLSQQAPASSSSSYQQPSYR